MSAASTPPGARGRPSPTPPRSTPGRAAAPRRRRRRSRREPARRRRTRRACRRLEGVERAERARSTSPTTAGEWWSPPMRASARTGGERRGAGEPGEGRSEDPPPDAPRRVASAWKCQHIHQSVWAGLAGSPNIGGGICSRTGQLSAKPIVIESQRSTRSQCFRQPLDTRSSCSHPNANGPLRVAIAARLQACPLPPSRWSPSCWRPARAAASAALVTSWTPRVGGRSLVDRAVGTALERRHRPGRRRHRRAAGDGHPPERGARRQRALGRGPEHLAAARASTRPATLDAGAVVIGLGDQPFVTPAAWRAVAAADAAIGVATYDGTPRPSRQAARRRVAPAADRRRRGCPRADASSTRSRRCGTVRWLTDRH